MLLTNTIEIVDVGPRDGLQIEPTLLSTDTKVAFIEKLIDAGIRRIEVTSFVNPRKVPQMADASELLARLPSREDVTYVGLVLNQRGFERACDAGCKEVGMVVAATDAFNRRNQGVPALDSIAAWRDVAHSARESGMRAHICLAVAFGCPFEGEVDLSHLIELAQRVAEDQPAEISLADTIGVAVPAQVAEVVSRVRAKLPGIPIRCHFHNTRSTGLANAWAAVQSGAVTLDASCGGVGGCPFAPDATGNIATEDLVYMLERSGVRTGAALASLIETSRWLADQLGHPTPGMLARAGAFPGMSVTQCQ
jgi:hydroxymethylglutaryl-CoA lyase